MDQEALNELAYVSALMCHRRTGQRIFRTRASGRVACAVCAHTAREKRRGNRYLNDVITVHSTLDLAHASARVLGTH
eukprot:4964713-Prymnesium_polylepis.1